MFTPLEGLAEALRFDPEEGRVIRTPDGPGPGHWVGASSATLTPDGRVLLTYLRSRPHRGGPDDDGYQASLAVSTNGMDYTDLWHVAKRDVPTSSLGRFCVRTTPAGDSLLFPSWEEPANSARYSVYVIHANTPDALHIENAEAALTPADVGVDALLDPCVFIHDGQQYLYVNAPGSLGGSAPTCLAVSTDGVHFSWAGEVLSCGEGWDGGLARLTSVFRWGSGFGGVYGGAASPSNHGEERCGVAFSKNLVDWERYPEPVLSSPHGSRSVRYVEVLDVGGAWLVFYEYERADHAHELRVFELVLPPDPELALAEAAPTRRQVSTPWLIEIPD